MIFYTFFTENVAIVRFNFDEMLSELRDTSQKMQKISKFTENLPNLAQKIGFAS